MVQEAEIKPEGISASSDGLRSYLSIVVSFIFRKSKFERFDVSSIKAKLKLKNPNVLLSETVALYGISVLAPEIKPELRFDFIIDDKAINAIEKYRNGDIWFSIELSISALIKSSFLLTTQQEKYSFDRIDNEMVNIDLFIPKSIWIEKIIPNTGFQSLKLIEIPLSHRNLSEAYDNIILEFTKAEKYFNQQDYDKCVAHCRNALDSISRNLKKINNKMESESAFKWLENIDKATYTWIDTLNKANSSITSKAHHAGQKKEFSRHEAESIYLITLGLLNFIGHLSS